MTKAIKIERFYCTEESPLSIRDRQMGGGTFAYCQRGGKALTVCAALNAYVAPNAANPSTPSNSSPDWQWREVGPFCYEIVNRNRDGGYLLPHLIEQEVQTICDGLNGKEATDATG